MATAKPSRASRPRPSAKTPKAKPAARAGRATAPGGSNERPSDTKPKKSTLDRPKASLRGLNPEQKQMRRFQARIAEKQINAIEQKIADKKIKDRADKILKAMERKEIDRLARAYAETRMEELRAMGDSPYAAGTDDLYALITPSAEAKVRKRETMLAKAHADKAEAERQQSAAQAQGIAQMNPNAKGAKAKPPAKGQPKAKRGGKK